MSPNPLSAVPKRFCSQSLVVAMRLAQGSNTPPYFFLGTTPSQAVSVISPIFPAAGVMLSRSLEQRRSDFRVEVPWIFDSGAFSEISQFGDHRLSPAERAGQVLRWSTCGELLAAVTQDYMCEPSVLHRSRVGGTVADHQRATIERYDALLELTPKHCYTMPVLQGWDVSDYLHHLAQYGSRLLSGAWVGVGSVCRRNSVREIRNILASIKAVRPDLRLHGFGLKLEALTNESVRTLLFSCDSMAATFPRRYGSDKTEIELCHDYQKRIALAAAGDYVRNRPMTAGAGNGQGRKPQWSSPTVPVRLPQEFRNGKTLNDLLKIARDWDTAPGSL